MINMSKEEFEKCKIKNKVFAIKYEENGDEITPITIFYELSGKYKFLFESAILQNNTGRYSFIGENPYMSIKSQGDKVIITKNEKSGTVIENYNGKVLDYVKKYTKLKESELFDIPFCGGAVGYVGYDVARQYEKLENVNEDKIKVPESYLMFYKMFISYDHMKHTVSIIYIHFPEDDKSYEEILNKMEKMSYAMKKGGSHKLNPKTLDKKQVSNVSKEKYCSMVECAKKYITDGDIFQVVLSQRLEFESKSEPFEVYRRLRCENPSPYLFYIDFMDFQVAGSSPEVLVAVAKGIVKTNPIAGTSRRGKTPEEDEKLKDELMSDEKERAEHLMLVDLGRNDIGRISEFGSVNLDRFMEIDYYSHVMHIVSEVSGKLKKEYTCFDALASCLPVGTVSGAPKIRAMQIIDELEDTKRGIYAGAVGYFSFNGDMDTCIAIRTIVFKDGKAYVQAGAGLVYDSNPEEEYIETLNKAMALTEVL